MSYNDYLADEMSNARHCLLNCKNDANEIKRLYFLFKNLSLNLSSRFFNSSVDFNSPIEWTHFSILEDLVPALSSSSLCVIIQEDNELRSYVNEWIEIDGFIAKIKYKTKPPNLDFFNSAA